MNSMKRQTIDSVPIDIKQELARYGSLAARPRELIYRILANDLHGAAMSADSDGIGHLLYAITVFVYHELPISIYGSQAKVDSWLAKGVPT